ncbi:MAG: xanthine dehydrogenase accessory protein XdhC [Gammaproteobacteria bacterium]
MNWIDAIAKLSRDNTGFVLVTVLSTAGSAPRGRDAKMVVEAARSYDTIGGGNLEFESLKLARELLAEDAPAVCSRDFSLGADLTQCCGGTVSLLFECFPACKFSVALFGAGHVGQALATILAQLPCRLRWIDSRADMFPAALLESAGNIETAQMQNPFEAVEACAPGAYYFIMTHSHETDIELCEAILARGDGNYCGLIGSKSKGAKFRSRLRKKGFTDAELAGLTCPIGLDAIPGKTPMEVAVSAAGQLLGLHHRAQVEASKPAKLVVG